MTILEGFIISLFTACVAGPIGAWVALYRFRSERWWERKAEAYTLLLNSLHGLVEELDQLTDEEMGIITEIPEDRKQQLAKTSRRAWVKIKKLSRMGTFLLSPDAETRIKQLEKEFSECSNEDTYFDHIDCCYGVVNRAMEDLKVIARSDLKIQHFSIFSRAPHNPPSSTASATETPKDLKALTRALDDAQNEKDEASLLEKRWEWLQLARNVCVLLVVLTALMHISTVYNSGRRNDNLHTIALLVQFASAIGWAVFGTLERKTRKAFEALKALPSREV